jgi:DNA processing protein
MDTRRGLILFAHGSSDPAWGRTLYALAERIAEQGAIVSEFPPGVPPLPAHFPQRNRLISGLSVGVLVVEAAPRSGSLITARLAADFGREVLAIPGSIDSPLARGCHALIRDGARLVESAEDVLSELSPVARTGGTPEPRAFVSAHSDGDACLHEPVADPPDPLLDAVGHDPVAADTLAAHLALPLGEVAARLVVHELAGRLQRLPDGRVVRSPPADRLAIASTRLL